MYLGKILYYLPEIIQKKIKPNNIKTIRNTIRMIYDLLDTNKEKKNLNQISNNLLNLNDDKFYKLLSNKEFIFNFIFEPFVNIPMDNIKTAASLLELPLDESVYIPALNTWTKTKVPVGIAFINSMEQTAEDYESLRSTGAYKASSSQPVKGRSRNGGQSLGNLDVYNLLAYDVPQVLEELMTVRSDDFKSKREMSINILETGESKMPEETGDAATQNLYEIHMIGMGLSPK